MKLTLPPKPSVPPVVRPVVRLALPGKPPLHVMRARMHVAQARNWHTWVIAHGKSGADAMGRHCRVRRRECIAAACAALAQGKV